MANPIHESRENLPEEVLDTQRAINSLIEELEAVDWYNQRAAATGDEPLKAILLHNRDEEIEHAAMCLEWLRRRIPKFDEELRTYLFSSEPITEIEDGEEEGGEEPSTGSGSGDLGIGKNQ